MIAAIVGSASGSLLVCLCGCCAFALWWKAYGQRRLRVYERERRNVKITMAPLTAATAPGSRRASVMRRGVLAQRMERSDSSRSKVADVMDPEL